MSFQFSHQFHSNWLTSPAITRRQIKTDLEAIVELLKPNTSLVNWQKQHGINQTDTSKAEQASLFTNEEESVNVSHDNLQKHTFVKNNSSANISNDNYGFANSSFLQNVTAGITNQESNHTAESSGFIKTNPNRPNTQLSPKKITADNTQVNSDIEVSKTALNPRALAEHHAKSSTQSKHDMTNHEEFLAKIEEKVDDYLSYAMQNIKKDVMDWVKDELLQK